MSIFCVLVENDSFIRESLGRVLLLCMKGFSKGLVNRRTGYHCEKNL